MRYFHFLSFSRFVRGVVALSVVFAGVYQGYALGYQLDIFVQTGDVFAGRTLDKIFNGFSKSDNGEIVFSSDIDGGKCTGTVPIEPGCAIFSSQRGLLVKSGDLFGGVAMHGVGISTSPVTNSGVVGFFANNIGVFVHQGGNNTLIFQHGNVVDGKTIDALGQPIMNNNEVAANHAGLLSPAPGTGIFTWHAGIKIRIVSTGDTISGKVLGVDSSVPSLNDNDDMVFLFDIVGKSEKALFGRIGGVLQLLLDPNDPMTNTIAGKSVTRIRIPHLNTAGDIVFIGEFTGGQGLFLLQGGVGTLIADTSQPLCGHTLTSFAEVDLNDNGDVVFTDSARTVVCARVGGVFQRVATNGDIVEREVGGVVEQYTILAGGFFSPQIYNDGVIGFGASFSDGDPALIFATPSTTPTFTCIGFGAPMNNGPVTVKGKRALPLRGQLRDANNNLITDAGVTASPVLQVLFDSGMGGDPIDVTDNALPAGQGSDGNQFIFDPVTQEWHYNLSSKNYTAEGTYLLLMVSGNETEYRIDPTCTATFVRE